MSGRSGTQKEKLFSLPGQEPSFAQPSLYNSHAHIQSISQQIPSQFVPSHLPIIKSKQQFNHCIWTVSICHKSSKFILRTGKIATRNQIWQHSLLVNNAIWPSAIHVTYPTAVLINANKSKRFIPSIANRRQHPFVWLVLHYILYACVCLQATYGEKVPTVCWEDNERIKQLSTSLLVITINKISILYVSGDSPCRFCIFFLLLFSFTLQEHLHRFDYVISYVNSSDF